MLEPAPRPRTRAFHAAVSRRGLRGAARGRFLALAHAHAHGGVRDAGEAPALVTRSQVAIVLVVATAAAIVVSKRTSSGPGQRTTKRNVNRTPTARTLKPHRAGRANLTRARTTSNAHGTTRAHAAVGRKHKLLTSARVATQPRGARPTQPTPVSVRKVVPDTLAANAVRLVLPYVRGAVPPQHLASPRQAA